jgi:serine/threonine protein kinase
MLQTQLQPQQILVDRYQLQTQLSDRPSRQTWLAMDLSANRNVILKLLPLNPQTQWEEIKLFDREAQILKNLNHPQIPQYLDYFQLDAEQEYGLPGFGLVQEYIPGKTLHQMLDEGVRFTEARVRFLAIQLLEIIIYLHDLSPPVLHRDLKPSNIIFQAETSEESTDRGIVQGKVYLIDFGSVRDRAVAEGATFTVVGTGGYAPPEQLWGRATPKSDLYALGATLIHLLTGKPPADLPQQRMRLQFRDFAYLTPQFADWLDKLTDPAPERRFSSARLALEALNSDNLANKNPLTISPVPEPIARSKYIDLGVLTFLQYGIVVCVFWILSNLMMSDRKTTNAEARSYVGAMNRAQQVYRREQGQFAPSYQALQIGLPSQSKNYQYSMQVTPLASFHRATPRHQKSDGLQKPKGHVGAVFATGPKTTAPMFCQAESAGMNPPPYPIVRDGVARCAAGTVGFGFSSMKPEVPVGRDWELADRTLSDIAKGEFDGAIELAETIKDPTYQLMTFLTLADKYVAMGNTEQAEKWRDRSVSIAEEIKVGSVRFQNLVDFASQYAAMGKTDFKEQLLAKALETTKTLIKEGEQADALVAIAPHLNKTEQQNTILYMASAFPSDWRKANVLEAIAPHLKTPEQWDWLWQMVSAFRSDMAKANVLSAIAPHLKTPEQWDRLWQMVSALGDDMAKVNVLGAITPYLKTAEQQDRFLQIVPTFPYDSPKSKVLMEIIPDLKTDRQLDRAEQIAQNFDNDRQKEQVLKAIEQAR